MKNKVFVTVRKISAYISNMHIPVYASHASFFITLSAFPMLLLLVSLLRYTGISVESVMESLDGIIPGVLLPFVKKQIHNTYQSTSGTILSLSALTALWSASRGLYGLRNGLNAIYNVSESRSWLYARFISVLYTFAFLAVVVLTLVLHVFGGTLLQLVPASWAFFINMVNLRFFLLLILQSGVFTAMYMALPNKRNGFFGSLPGGVFSSLGWLILSDLYSRYVENFSGYSNIYGSVYALALSMLWLYCCVSILFYGAALNVYLADEQK